MKTVRVLLVLGFLIAGIFSSPKCASSDQTFLVKLNGEKIGDEIFSYSTATKDTNTVVFSSKTKLSIQGMTFLIDQEERLDKNNWSFSKYSLKADIMGQYQEGEAKVVNDTIQASLSVGGQELKNQLPYRENHVIIGLTTSSAYFYQILLNKYDFDKKGTQSFYAFLPDKLGEGPLRVTYKDKCSAALKKEEFEVDHLEAVLVSVVINIWAKASDHQLLKVDIPLMRFESSVPELSIRQSGEVKAPQIIDATNFLEREASFKSGEFEISGTLSLPNDMKVKVPAVILIHGSGPQDRDETIGPNKPFKDIANALANSGFAVLRYDKRTYSYKPPKLDPVNITLKEEVIDDALEGIKFLREQKEINPQRIFVLGHSLGAECVPLIVLQDKKLEGGIMLAAPARPADSLIFEQLEFQAGVAEASGGEEIKRQLNELKSGFLQIREGVFPDSQMLFFASGKYWRSWLDYSARDTIKKIGCPVLILQGEKDCQVSMEDFEIWKKVLAGSKSSTLLSFPNLNHLFMYVEGKSTGEEYQREGHVSEAPLKSIIEWINKHST